jgi:hypothetical protein
MLKKQEGKREERPKLKDKRWKTMKRRKRKRGGKKENNHNIRGRK